MIRVWARGRDCPPQRVTDMEFIVLVIAFIALLTAMAARKQGASLQLQLNGVLTRLSRLQDELAAQRRVAPQAPIPDAAGPHEMPTAPEAADRPAAPDAEA